MIALRHTCHATGCNVTIAEQLFMCARHWRLVPRPLRDELWAEYVPGQEQRKDPTWEYLDVAFRCIEEVSRLEQAAPRERGDLEEGRPGPQQGTGL